MSVDKELNQHIGLPDSYNLDRAKACELFNYFKLITKSSAPTNHLTLMYYIDRKGDFTKGNTRDDLIIQAILSNLDAEQQTAVNEYIEDHIK
jgi:hypothetical protein